MPEPYELLTSKVAGPFAGEDTSLPIRIGARFDISATRQIHRAIEIARDKPFGTIVIDLTGTRHLHDSGMALVLRLHAQTAHLKHRISLINCQPEIRRKLAKLSIGPLLHIT